MSMQRVGRWVRGMKKPASVDVTSKITCVTHRNVTTEVGRRQSEKSEQRSTGKKTVTSEMDRKQE